MIDKQGWFQIFRWKIIAFVVLAPLVWFVSAALGFPTVFRMMFVFYVFLGTMVFIVLDFPWPKEVSQANVGKIVTGFFAVVAIFFAIFGSLWPQFSVQHELGGINRKMRKYEREAQAAEPLRQKAEKLAKKTDLLLAKLAKLESAGVKVAGVSRKELEASMDTFEGGFQTPGGSLAGLDGKDLVDMGKLVYQDYECYNCHKIGGKGGKKRGPVLDNIGNLVTAEQLKQKILNPEAWKAEGFEERTKDEMPDKYRDIMGKGELKALIAYLMTLKDSSVDTPKPVFPKKS